MSAAVEERIVDLQEVEPPPAEEPAPRPSKRYRRRAGAALLIVAGFVAAFLVFLFVLSPFVEARQQRMIASRMRSLSAQGPASVLGWQPNRGDPVAVLLIPTLALQVVVLQGTDAGTTMAGPGHLAASPLPGSPGNSVIMGRRATFGSPFGSLDALHVGDEIEVDTGVGSFRYKVSAVAPVAVGAADVIGPSQDNRLTLVTSDPPGRATARLAVTAMLKGDPAPQPAQLPETVSPAEAGMAGDRGALPALLVWGELLIAAVVAIALFRRSVPVRVAWLLGTPIVLALSWGTFVALARLLPATL